MPADLAHELDVALRLVVASLLGAAIGLERELHEHPAGMRTHLLVAVGSALFTVVSIFGFVDVLAAGQGAPVDPSRVAAQIVTGIGFLGAGAILKFGTTVRGLTTAASLWTAAAIGMAAGAGDYILAGVGTAIVVFSLWPLTWVEDKLHGPSAEIANVRLELRSLEAIGRISEAARANRLDLVSIDTQRISEGRHEMDLHVRVRSATELESFIKALASLNDVDILESGGRE